VFFNDLFLGETTQMRSHSLLRLVENEMTEMWGSSFGVHPWLISHMLSKPNGTVMAITTNVPSQEGLKKE
jgi:hypothetical protein